MSSGNGTPAPTPTDLACEAVLCGVEKALGTPGLPDIEARRLHRARVALLRQLQRPPVALLAEDER